MRLTVDSLLAQAMTSGTPAIVDGAMGTVLEARGIDLGHELWSADLLRRSPEILAKVHADYARAGARIVSTASYQATPLGFERAGVKPAEGRALIEASVRIAAEAVATVHAGAEVVSGSPPSMSSAGPSILVAGSIGPYGAALGDGSEYTGSYALTAGEFADFHRPRIEALVAAGADLLALETQPHLGEIEILAGLADEYRIPAWLSVTLRAPSSRERVGAHPDSDESPPTLADGTDLQAVASLASVHGSIRALGVNCVPPRLVGPALRALSQATTLPLIAYPNSGEVYDAQAMEWRADTGSAVSTSGPTTSASASIGEPAAMTFPLDEWVESGLRLVGGCCRTTPADIAALARSVSTRS